MTSIAFCAVLVLFLLMLVSSSLYIRQLRRDFPDKWRELGKPEPWQVFGTRARAVSREVWQSKGEMTGLKLLINSLTVAYWVGLFVFALLIYRSK